MKTKKRQKLCYNCEGEIDLDVIVCPFCAADLREERPQDKAPLFDPSASLKNLSMNQSLYPPEKRMANPEEEEGDVEDEIEEEPLDDAGQRSMIGPTLLITLGAQLLLISIFMLLFSKEGTLTLQWNAKHWFFYFLASAPLLFFGVRSLQE